jgi:Na+-driven multidrug efflux pump
MFPLVAAIGGIEAAGILRALQNLFTPIIQFNSALNLAILPRVSDKIVAVGPSYARSFAIYASLAFTGTVLLYAMIVLSEAKPILALIYRKPEIIAATSLLWPLAFAMILESTRIGSSIALLALGQTRVFFTVRMAAIAVLLGATAILAPVLGFEGVLWANVISHLVATILFVPKVLGIEVALASTKAMPGSKERPAERGTIQTLSP